MRILAIAMALVAVGCIDEAGEPGTGAPLEMSAPQAPMGAPPFTLSESQEEGGRLYNMLCWTCHGEAGRGDGPLVEQGEVPAPPNFQLGEYAGVSPDELEARVLRENGEGVDPGDHMRYIRAIVRADKLRETLEYIPMLVWPAEVPGSAIKGRATYAVRCQLCHGDTGKGDGYLGRSLSSIKPADFTQDTLIAKRDWDGLHARLAAGGRGSHTAMPPFGSFFSDNEMWDLVAYIATFQPDALQAAGMASGG